MIFLGFFFDKYINMGKYFNFYFLGGIKVYRNSNFFIKTKEQFCYWLFLFYSLLLLLLGLFILITVEYLN